MSDKDTESNHNDSDYEDEVDNYQKNKYNKKYKYDKDGDVPSEGIEISDVNLQNVNPTIKTFTCEACNKIFGNYMKIDMDEIVYCAHCFYLMNYGNKEIMAFSTMPIDQYIFTCASSHKSPCSKLKDTGGCYLCMANLGMTIDDLEGLGFGYDEVISKPSEKKKERKYEIYDDKEIIIVEKEKTEVEMNNMLSKPLVL